MAPPAQAVASPQDEDGDARATPAPGEHKQAASAMSGGVAAVTTFLQSKGGKQMQKEVVRGVFGRLKKRL